MKTIANAASEAAHKVKDSASRTETTVAEFGVQALKFLDALRAQEIPVLESFLRRIGLPRRRSAVSPILYFVAGAVVAGSAALILAPTSGKALRKAIVAQWHASKGTSRGAMGTAGQVLTVAPPASAPLDVGAPSNLPNGAAGPASAPASA